MGHTPAVPLDARARPPRAMRLRRRKRGVRRRSSPRHRAFRIARRGNLLGRRPCGPLWRAAISADSDKCRIVRRYDRAFCSPCLGRVDRQRDDTDVMDVYTSLMLCAHNTPPSLTHAGVSFSIRSVSSLMGFFASSFTRSIGVLPVPFCAVMSQPFSRSALTAKVFP